MRGPVRGRDDDGKGEKDIWFIMERRNEALWHGNKATGTVLQWKEQLDRDFDDGP